MKNSNKKEFNSSTFSIIPASTTMSCRYLSANA